MRTLTAVSLAGFSSTAARRWAQHQRKRCGFHVGSKSTLITRFLEFDNAAQFALMQAPASAQ